jgi:hypothetical protein
VLVACLSDRRDLSLYNSTPTVRTWDHSQCAIFFSAGIEVKTQGKHLLQHGGRRLDVKNVGLYGPRSESIRLDPVLNSDGYILVPWHFPICVWNLIEKDSPHRIAFSSKYRLNQMADGWRASKLPYLRRRFKQIANSENTDSLPDVGPRAGPLDGRQKFFDFCRRDNGLALGEAVLLDFIADH